MSSVSSNTSIVSVTRQNKLKKLVKQEKIIVIVKDQVKGHHVFCVFQNITCSSYETERAERMVLKTEVEGYDVICVLKHLHCFGHQTE